MKYFINLIPEKYLPKVHRTEVNVTTKEIKKIEFSIEERRDHLIKILRGNIKKVNQKYSPIYFFINKFKKMKIINNKRKITYLVGKITLLCAALEQEMKRDLVENLGEAPNKYLYGAILIRKFKNVVNNSALSDELKGRYLDLADKFEILAKERNDKVKTIYGHDSNTGATVEIDHFKRLDRKNDISEFVRVVKIEDFNNLIASLEKLQYEWNCIVCDNLKFKVQKQLEESKSKENSVTVKLG